MRSSVFIILSVLAHAACVAAIALAPQRLSEIGNQIEVSMGATEATNEGGQAAEPTLEPVKPVEEAKAAPPVATAKPTAKPAAKPVTKKAAEPVVAEASDEAETPVKEEIPEELTPEVADTQQPEEKPEFVPVKETAPVGVQPADASTEADVKDMAMSEDPTPVAPVVPVVASGAGANTTDDGELNKGGETQAAAVSFLNLQQAKGNQAPQYPLMARKEGRSGQLELLYRVTKEGQVADVQIAKSSGHKDLDSAAVKAIAKFRFVPGQEGWARHPVAFNLKGDPEKLPGKLRSAKSE